MTTTEKCIPRQAARSQEKNPLHLKTLHHIEFWVGNAKQAAHYYRYVFGFSQVAYAGLETGQRTHASYALTQGKARFVLSSPQNSSHPAAEHIKRHGDGVRDICFDVRDADESFHETLPLGAFPPRNPATPPHTNTP